MKKDTTLHIIALVTLLTLSAYFLADTVDAMIGRSLEAAPIRTSIKGQERPAVEPRKELSSYSSILERGLFGDGKQSTQAGGQKEISSFTLIGTIEGERFAGAVLEDKTGQAFYRLNQKLPDGSTLVKVMRDRAAIRRTDGVLVNLQVEDTKIIMQPSAAGSTLGVRRLGDGRFLVDQKEVLASTENMSQILTQARALPYQENGKTVGFRISEITPGSIYEKIGLQNGDVIQRVNAQDVDDPAKFFQLYQGLRNERSIAIDLLRAGQRQTLNYDIR
ncbi:MAG TPA: type II secretion system protein N [Nitrospirota bacterium]|nr:type II secretion system protein N [Nitrospirota bacterium]